MCQDFRIKQHMWSSNPDLLIPEHTLHLTVALYNSAESIGGNLLQDAKTVLFGEDKLKFSRGFKLFMYF